MKVKKSTIITIVASAGAVLAIFAGFFFGSLFSKGAPRTLASGDPVKNEFLMRGPSPAQQFERGRSGGMADRLATASLTKIKVIGNAEISVTPDIAVINLGIQKIADTAESAYDQTLQAMANTVAAVKGTGVASSDLMSQNCSVYPIYDYQSGDGTAITGYRSNSTVTVTVRDITNISAVFKAALAAGANENFGIEYRLSEKSPYYAEALRQAVQDAKQKAAILAQNGGELRLISIKETGKCGFRPISHRYDTLKADFAESDFYPGKITVNAEVCATFAEATQLSNE